MRAKVSGWRNSADKLNRFNSNRFLDSVARVNSNVFGCYVLVSSKHVDSIYLQGDLQQVPVGELSLCRYPLMMILHIVVIQIEHGLQ